VRGYLGLGPGGSEAGEGAGRVAGSVGATGGASPAPLVEREREHEHEGEEEEEDIGWARGNIHEAGAVTGVSWGASLHTCGCGDEACEA
jgi:hypothetical protein